MNLLVPFRATLLPKWRLFIVSGPLHFRLLKGFSMEAVKGIYDRAGGSYNEF